MFNLRVGLKLYGIPVLLNVFRVIQEELTVPYPRPMIIVLC